MDTDSLIAEVKVEDICVNIAKDVESRPDTSSYELDPVWPNGWVFV